MVCVASIGKLRLRWLREELEVRMMARGWMNEIMFGVSKADPAMNSGKSRTFGSDQYDQLPILAIDINYNPFVTT